MASRGRGGGQGGGRIGGGGSRDHVVYRLVVETPAERRARIVRSETARKHAVRKWTNYGARPPPKLAPYAAYATGGSSSRYRPHSPTPPSASDDDDVQIRDASSAPKILPRSQRRRSVCWRRHWPRWRRRPLRRRRRRRPSTATRVVMWEQ
jgi:hypothetical protein